MKQLQTFFLTNEGKAYWRVCCLFLVFSGLGSLLSAQSIESAGRLPTTVFLPEEYGGHYQVWDVIEGARGLIYAAHTDGILEYDGVHWRPVFGGKHRPGVVTNLKKNAQGRIFYTGLDRFGYLKVDSTGATKAVALDHCLPKDHLPLGHLNNIEFQGPYTYLHSDARNLLIQYEFSDNDSIISMKTWKSETIFSSPFVMDGTLYIQQTDSGLYHISEGELKLVSGTERLGEQYVQLMLPYPDSDDGKKQYLLGCSWSGLYILKGKTLTELPSQIHTYIDEDAYLTNGTMLDDGNYALSFRGKGVLVINPQGEILRALNTSTGLQSDIVYNLYTDSKGFLWICTEEGMAVVEVNSPVVRYGKDAGIGTQIWSFEKSENGLFLGTSTGLLKYDPTTNKFEPVALIGNHEIPHLLSDGDDLLVGGRNPVVLKAEAAIPFRGFEAGDWPHAFLISRKNSDLLFVGGSKGLYLYKRGATHNAPWEYYGILEDVHGQIYQMCEDASGDVWATVLERTIFQINLSEHLPNAEDLQQIRVKSYTPSAFLGKISAVRGEVYAASLSGILKYSKAADAFIRDTLFNQAGNQPTVEAFEDARGRVWLHLSNGSSQLATYHADGKIAISDGPNIGTNETTTLMHHEKEDSILWAVSDVKTLMRIDEKKCATTKETFHTLIRRVTTKTDTLALKAYGTDPTTAAAHLEDQSFRFEFAAPYYGADSKTTYQTLLHGAEKDWVDWNPSTFKEYTNLPPGEYTFKVRARNKAGTASEAAAYPFKVLPPWHLTWWAYLLYALLAVLIFLGVNYYRTKQLCDKNLALEALVRERTEEMVAKNVQLEERTIQLREQTEQLKALDRMKARLFANISHEFRTPLTLIKGPIEVAESSPEKPMSVNNVKMIRRNADRLLKLVNQLLDLSKIDARSLRLEPSEGNTFMCLRAAASSFSSHAAQRNMDYHIKIPTSTLWASFDRDKLEKIVYNLLSNAFKFTSDNGTVVFTASYTLQHLRIEVKDTGQGIPAENLPKVFDRFYQVDDSFTKEKEGTGIGLALTKELVDLMGGEIFVESEYGKGSSFKVIIPLEEIVAPKRAVEQAYSFPENGLDEPAEETVKKEHRVQKTILIIEDHTDMRVFIRQQLTDDFRIIEALNGQDGLDKALKHTPDLIITDLMMPHIDGLTLCKELKLNIHTSHIPIIMLTAKAGIENKIEGLETGADDYLTKPFNALELQVRVRNLIDQRENLKERFTKGNYIHPKEVTVNSLDEQFLQKTLDLFEEMYADPDFGIADMQAALAMSKAQLHRKFKAVTSHPPGELLRNFRLKRAAQILEQKGESVTQVAYAVGFNNLSYFAKCFKELMGVSPSAYAKSEVKR